MSHDARVIRVGFLSFAALGLATGLLGLAWPSMRAQFGVRLDAVNQIFVISTASYLLVSFRIGRLMDRFGSAATLLAGTALLMTSSFGIAAVATWGGIIAFSAISGAGNGLIDSGLNLYVATHHGPRQMIGIHACFGLGATAGPLVMALVLQQKLAWQWGYVVAGLVVATPLLLIALTFRAWRNETPQTGRSAAVVRVTFARSARVPAVWTGTAMFACCVGLELAVGQWAYTLLSQARGMRPAVAGVVVGGHWATFTGGRILFGFVADRFDLRRLLRATMGGTFAGAALFCWNPTTAVGVFGLLLLGFSEAPVFPLLMSGTSCRVGAEHTANAVGLQMVAAGAASAALPGLVGTAGTALGLESMSACFVILSAIAWGICLLPVRGPKAGRIGLRTAEELRPA